MTFSPASLHPTPEQLPAPLPQSSYLHLCLRAATCTSVSEQLPAPLSQSSYLHLCLRAAICTSVSEQPSAPLSQSSHLHLCLRAAICTSVSEQLPAPLPQSSYLHLCLRAAICTSAPHCSFHPFGSKPTLLAKITQHSAAQKTVLDCVSCFEWFVLFWSWLAGFILLCSGLLMR